MQTSAVRAALEIHRATFHEDGESRWYVDSSGERTDLSVTEVLDEAGFYRWFQRHPEAAERGTVVHEILELLDLGELDPDSIDPELEGYVRAYRAAREAIGPVEMIAIEHGLARNGIGGRLDRCWVVGQTPEFVDLKTGAGGIDPVAFIQLAGYSDLAHCQTKVRRRVIKLRADGTWATATRGPREYQADWQAWLAARTLAVWKRAQ